MDQTSATGNVNIRIKEFFPAPRNAKDPKSEVVDWIAYYPTNQNGQTLVRKPVCDLLNIAVMDDPQNPLLVLAHQRKAAIEPAYKAYKANEQVPLNGFPLRAWRALSAQQSQIIEHAGIRTVEELADALDSTIALIKLPNPKDLRTMAQRFVASKDQDAAVAMIQAAEAEKNEMRDQMKQMMDNMAAMQRQMEAMQTMQMQAMPQPPDEDDMPRRGGSRSRQHKVDEAA